MTGIELVKEYFPDVGDHAEYILWNETCYPFGGEEHIRPQLKKLKQAYKLKRQICAECGKMKWPSQMKVDTCLGCFGKL